MVFVFSCPLLAKLRPSWEHVRHPCGSQITPSILLIFRWVWQKPPQQLHARDENLALHPHTHFIKISVTQWLQFMTSVCSTASSDLPIASCD